MRKKAGSIRASKEQAMRRINYKIRDVIPHQDVLLIEEVLKETPFRIVREKGFVFKFYSHQHRIVRIDFKNNEVYNVKICS